MSFKSLQLHAKLLETVAACGYTKPTPVQTQAIPPILQHQDVVAQAPTGTGKTAAYVLPILHRLTLKKYTGKPQVLILAPTRELATQIADTIHKYGRNFRFNIVNIVGGVPFAQQLRALAGQVNIIIATPGRLADHINNKRLDLSKIETLVLDEADRMLDMGFVDEVKKIIALTPKNRQTLLFSATIDSKLMLLIKTLMKRPVKINLLPEKHASSLIKQGLYFADDVRHKTQILNHFLINTQIYKAIIFSATKRNADKLASYLRANGHSAACLHGDLKQTVRTRTLEQLRRGKIQFLVATDVAARGIDVLDISHVINYDLPRFSEDYIHRIGRTGRAGKTGIAISIAIPADKNCIRKIERFIGKSIPRMAIAGLTPQS